MKNYRPTSLINVDLKILTKTLTNRLKEALPSIIHFTQTAVDGRRIDNTVHMLRDFVQLANAQNLESAFIFLDEEKAFDRVNHAFVYKTIRAFGIGPVFIRGYARSIPMRPLGSKSTAFLVITYPYDVAYDRGARSAPFFTFLLLRYLLCSFGRIPILSVLLWAGRRSSACIMLTMQ